MPACVLKNARGFKNQRIKTAALSALILACLFFTGVSRAAQEARAPQWPHETSDLAPDPQSVYGRLENGFRYVLMKNREPRDRVSVHLNVQAGSLNETGPERGLAHFLEHMLFRGSDYFKPGELIKYFQSIGMSFGPDVNAHTGFEKTVYDIILPDGSQKTIAKALLAAKDFAAGALLLDKEIDRERKVVIAEKRTRDSVEYRTLVSSLEFEFPDALISRRLPIGTEEIISKAGRKELKAFYETWYRPDNMILVMVGDFDSEMAGALIQNEFSSLKAPAAPIRRPDIGDIRHKGIKTFYHHEKEAGSTTVSIETARKAPAAPDSAALRKDIFAADLADAIIRNRLEALKGEPGTPFTSAFIDSGTYLKTIRYSEIYAECEPEKWKESLALIEQTLRGALTHGFASHELDRVKKDFGAMLELGVKKAATRNSQGLARQIIFALNNNQVFMSPAQKKEMFAPLLKSLTLKDIHDAFRETWEADHRLVLVMGNARLAEGQIPPERRIHDEMEKSMASFVEKPKKLEKPRFPYLPEPGTAGKIVSKKWIPDLEIFQVDFANHVRLNIKKTDFDANSVQVNLTFGDGKLSQPAGKPGIAILAGAVVNESGLGALDKDGLERALSGKNASVHFYVAEDFFGLKGEAPPEEIPLLFQLLHAHIADPAFRKKAHRLSMERFRQDYRRLSATIDGAVKLHGERFFAGGDEKFGIPDSFDAFSKLSIDDVMAWVEPALRHDPIEISVAGDADVDQVIKAVSRYIGSLPDRKGSGLKKHPGLPRFPEGQIRKITVPTRLPKGLLTVAWPTEDIWNIKRARAFSVLGAIFSERLRVRIRETLGASYSPAAFNQSSKVYPEYGLLKTLVHADPEKIKVIQREVTKIAGDLSTNGVSADELQRAVEPILVRLKELRRKNAYWLDIVMTGSSKYPRQLDWSRSIIEDYQSFETDYISSLAKKYLDNARAAVLTIISDPGAEENAGEIAPPAPDIP
ncbi:conserved exported hypothetical protein [Candidatus Desulfarcum epimagneticum]|uniref:Peptidase M16 n=1 Tax=uncultured Desulfobacteraceae bacterium TaxID=218296 RepID=A0A484HKV0_9BACT|nr:conserved exported hypothetical protein [uncultured Desulfobacteraceae bacterium]